MAQPLMSAVASSASHALPRRPPLLAAVGIYAATALLGLLRAAAALLRRGRAAAPLPPERLLVGVVAALALLGGAGAPASAVGGLGLRLVEPPTLTQNCARVVDGDLSASALLRDGRRAWLVTPLSSRWVAAADSDGGAQSLSARRAPRPLLRSPPPLAAAPRCLRL